MNDTGFFLPDDSDSVMTGKRAWITAGPFSVSITRTDEGIAVDVYPYPMDDEDSGPVTSCWAMDSDLDTEDDDHYATSEE